MKRRKKKRSINKAPAPEARNKRELCDENNGETIAPDVRYTTANACLDTKIQT